MRDNYRNKKKRRNNFNPHNHNFDEAINHNRKPSVEDNRLRAQEIVSPYPVYRPADSYSNNNANQHYPRRYFRRERDFTPEERAKVLARVREVGVTKAADEFNTTKGVVMRWLDNQDRPENFDNNNRRFNKNKFRNNRDNRNNRDRQRDREQFNPRPEYNSPELPEPAFNEELNHEEIIPATIENDENEKAATVEPVEPVINNEPVEEKEKIETSEEIKEAIKEEIKEEALPEVVQPNPEPQDTEDIEEEVITLSPLKIENFELKIKLAAINKEIALMKKKIRGKLYEIINEK